MGIRNKIVMGYYCRNKGLVKIEFGELNGGIAKVKEILFDFKNMQCNNL